MVAEPKYFEIYWELMMAGSDVKKAFFVKYYITTGTYEAVFFEFQCKYNVHKRGTPNCMGV